MKKKLCICFIINFIFYILIAEVCEEAKISGNYFYEKVVLVDNFHFLEKEIARDIHNYLESFILYVEILNEHLHYHAI